MDPSGKVLKVDRRKGSRVGKCEAEETRSVLDDVKSRLDLVFEEVKAFERG